ncbi:MAG: acetyl-CoA carboxylase [Gaiellales bacterium]
MAAKTIQAPFPGTFYRRPSPEADPYVSEGDTVNPGDVVGLIEIMKNFHEVLADERGVVDSFLVLDEDLVEAGQALMALA